MPACKHRLHRLSLDGRWLWCLRCGSICPRRAIRGTDTPSWLRPRSKIEERLTVLATWGLEKDLWKARPTRRRPTGPKKPPRWPCSVPGCTEKTSRFRPLGFLCFTACSRPLRAAMKALIVQGVVDNEHRTPELDAAVAACVANVLTKLERRRAAARRPGETSTWRRFTR